MTPPSPSPALQTDRQERWKFLRDVLAFQLKMFLDNVRDFALMPISLGAAIIDLISKGDREGALFYRVLRWGSHSEKVIDVYSALKQHEQEEPRINPNYTVDGVISKLEGVLVREYEKGGTAATIKAAMDRAIDQLHSETQKPREKAGDMVSRATGTLRKTFDSEKPKND